jgi:hypothetical protein
MLPMLIGNKLYGTSLGTAGGKGRSGQKHIYNFLYSYNSYILPAGDIAPGNYILNGMAARKEYNLLCSSITNIPRNCEGLFLLDLSRIGDHLPPTNSCRVAAPSTYLVKMQ